MGTGLLAENQLRLGLPRERQASERRYSCFVASRNRHLLRPEKFQHRPSIDGYKDFFISLSGDPGPQACRAFPGAGRSDAAAHPRAAAGDGIVGRRTGAAARAEPAAGVAPRPDPVPTRGWSAGARKAAGSICSSPMPSALSRCSISIGGWTQKPSSSSLPMPRGSIRSAPTAPRRRGAISRPMPRPGTASARSTSPMRRSSGRSPSLLADRPHGRAARHRHRHGPDARIVRAQAAERDRHRPVVGNAAAGPGQAGGSRDFRCQPAPGRHVRAAARRPAAPTASSSTRCCIMRSSPVRRFPRRRGCLRPAGACW